ncbi:hypothetical protein NHP21005_08360 [Helicobacter sp. NHP21005]|uniref:hypothetical protein n=1 Tax=Helicobacter felistomachi TaxID=3040201 RepID=UPI00257425FE|nr:hypothetical protein [Helicobacter sp. NHP21005]BEG57148.1 hypothetical protein NHP21005_08360 [Helicobacter sp. NHP21005]
MGGVDKSQIVIQRNSFYFSNAAFEEQYEAGTLHCLKTLLLNLQNEVQNRGCKRKFLWPLASICHAVKSIGG